MAGIGEALVFKRPEGDNAWGTEKPVNREAALKIWEAYFRMAVTQALGL